MLWNKESVRSIARRLNRSPSSISREINKNIPPEHRKYTPRLANKRALKKRKNRGREERLKDETIREYVTSKLKSGYSPEQISGRIKIDLPEYSISHEAIYQYIYRQVHRNGYGYLKPNCEDLRMYLKRRHKRRIPKGARRCKRVNKIMVPLIEDRPSVVETRSRIGDMESDSVVSGKSEKRLNTLSERKSGMVFITKIPNGTSEETKYAILSRLTNIKDNVHTITFDNGSENMKWKDIQNELDADCYFTHPYSSWERGSNENTNGLIRWYFPKGTDFAKVTDEEVKEVEYALNTRPRKRLGWKTPLEVFNASVALQD
jgi:IS30 family transposase